MLKKCRTGEILLKYKILYLYKNLYLQTLGQMGICSIGDARSGRPCTGGTPRRPPGVDFHHGVPAGGGGAENAAFSTV